jgi:ketosteroid isomerase-like protein
VSDYSEFIAAARALDAAFVRHTKAGEVDRLVAACYADDALVLPPNLPLVQGRGQIRELFREMLEGGADDVVRETIALHVAGDLGYGVGTYTIAISSPARELVRETGKHVLIYRRQADGAWKVAVDMFSGDLPAR